MKRNLIVVFAVLHACVASVFSQGLTGDSWAQVKGNKKGKIIITHTQAPKFSEKVKGKYSGICFDILNDFTEYVKKQHGVTLTIEYKDLVDVEDFDLLLKTVAESKGGVIGLGDITITSERKKKLKFTDPYFNTIAMLVTNSNSPNLSDMANMSKDFAGMKAIVQKGTTHEARMRKIKKEYFPGLTIETTKGFDEADKKVLSDSKYFTYIDISTYFDVLDKKLPLKRQAAGDQKGESFGFIMPKTSDWDLIFNEFLAANGGYTKSVQYRKILSENLGKQVLNLIDTMNK